MTRAFVLLLFLAGSLCAQKDIVSLSSPLTETLYLLGAQDRLAAVSDTSVFPEQVVKDRAAGKIRTLTFRNSDLEAIKSLKPSLILTSTAFQKDVAEKLRAGGYRVLHFEPESLEAVLKQTEEIGKAVGKSKEAEAFTAKARREMAELAARSAPLPKIRVYMEINHEGPWTAGSRSPENEIIRIAGGENVFADMPAGVFQTNHDQVVKRNPEIILSPIWLNAHVGGIDGITTILEIISRPGYGSTQAVRNSRVLYYDSALLKHQGPREVLAIRKLAYLLHPETFENPPGTIPWELGRIRP